MSEWTNITLARLLREWLEGGWKNYRMLGPGSVNAPPLLDWLVITTRHFGWSKRQIRKELKRLYKHPPQPSAGLLAVIGATLLCARDADGGVIP